MNAVEREQFRAAVGPRADYYLERFAKYEVADGRWVASWSWPAFFLSSAWFAYRRMGSHSLANFFLPFPFIVLLFMMTGSEYGLLAVAGYLALAFVAIPLYANLFYYRHLKSQIARLAASAKDEEAIKALRPPSFVTGIEAFLTAVLAFVIPAMLVSVPAMYADYTPRSKVARGVELGASLKAPIAEFYHEHKRLPAPQEAGKFRVDGGKYTQSVLYDAEKRMIVVTMGDAYQDQRIHGKRFAIHAEAKDGTISWSCRTIDLNPKYLPAACRN